MDGPVSVGIYLSRDHVNFLDQEGLRLKRLDGGHRNYHRGTIITALIELYKTQRELAQLVEKDRRLLYCQVPEEWHDE